MLRQIWRHLTFLHWRYDAAALRPLVPRQLRIDTFDGSAWVGLVPFLITDLTLPRAPALPWISRFPEMNVRTYVVDCHGRRGVWFFSLDAARLAAAIGARAAFGLPYFWSRMSVKKADDVVEYDSSGIFRRARSAIRVGIGSPLANQSELEIFLTARFRLYALRFGSLVEASVEHQPWPLQRASILRCEESLMRAAGLHELCGEPLAHFAPRVDVLVAAPRRVAEPVILE